MTNPNEWPTSWGEPRGTYGDTWTKQNLTLRKMVLAKNPDYDVKSYARGWRASMPDNETVNPPLDLADSRGECTEWYDGYYDMALGRDKWHTALWFSIDN